MVVTRDDVLVSHLASELVGGAVQQRRLLLGRRGDVHTGTLGAQEVVDGVQGGDGGLAASAR
jgi:hypothetical protein